MKNKSLITNFMKPHKDILQDPHPLLKVISKPVLKIDNAVTVISNNLTNTLKQLDRPYRPWLGIAAPQIGYSKRIIALKIGRSKYLTMINPEILGEKYRLPAVSGCFSLKGLYLIRSPYWLKFRYKDLAAKEYQEVFRGGKAVVLQQEISHLNGRLIND